MQLFYSSVLRSVLLRARLCKISAAAVVPIPANAAIREASMGKNEAVPNEEPNTSKMIPAAASRTSPTMRQT